ncbi:MULTISPECIES: glycoside hydrolase family 43 protein [unclassified Arthrobacter]|uniref:glycoside hydrolase family 43 protein n=1 Tax=unclassified Arthrobacter TaxID=235627 RepID=UPI000CE467A7|nr:MULTISPECIES: glycoside hydrolase family 43 protein [unclassified Arthrobacter]
MSKVPAPEQSLTFTNPLLEGMHPDPSICRQGDTFYLVNSTFEYLPGLPVYASTNLVHWDLIGHAITRPEQLDLSSARASGGLFAPTIREHNGLFYIACTAVGVDGPSGSFYITAASAAGPWSNPVWLPDAAGIDPTIFFDGDDIWWAGCRQVVEPEYEGQTEIWLQRLDPVEGRLTGPEHILWTGAVKGAIWAEGPHLYKHGEYFYLLAAEGGTGDNHAVSVARANHVTGPYLGNPRNPVLTHRNFGGTAAVQCVGHADLVQATDGSWWAVALATRPRHSLTLLGRETFLAPVAWENDWPVFNPGLGCLPESGEVPAFVTAETIAAAEQPLITSPNPVRRVLGRDEPWITARGFPAQHMGEAGSENRIALLSTGARVDRTEPAAALGVRLSHHTAAFAATVERLLRSPAAGGPMQTLVGISLSQSPESQIRAELSVEKEARIDIVEVAGGVSRIVESRNLDGETFDRLVAGEPAGIELRMAVLDGATVRVETGTDGAGVLSADLPARVLSTEAAGGFVGAVASVYSMGTAGTGAVFAEMVYEH